MYLWLSPQCSRHLIATEIRITCDDALLLCLFDTSCLNMLGLEIFLFIKSAICHTNIYSAAMPATSSMVFVHRQAVLCVQGSLNNDTAHSSRFDHRNNILWGIQIIQLSLCSFLPSPATSSLFGPNILLNTLFSNTLSQRSSFSVSD